MTEQTGATTQTTDEQIQEGLEAAFDFLEAAFDDPALFDLIPRGSTVLHLPSDDPAKAKARLVRAMALVAQGKQVVLVKWVGESWAVVPVNAWLGR